MPKNNRSTTLKGSGADRDPAKLVFAKSGEAAKKLMAQSLSSLRQKKRAEYRASITGKDASNTIS